MGVRSHPERSLMPWSASTMLPHGGGGHYRTAHCVRLNTQLYGSASQAFGCVVTAVVNLSGAFWPQLIPSAILGPAVTAIRTAGFFELFRGNGCTWAPWRPLRCDHTKLQEPHRNQLFLHFIYHPVGLPIHLLSF